MADFGSIKPQPRSDYEMTLKVTEELLILKLLCKMYENALTKNNKLAMIQIAVDISESADKLEQHSVDNVNS